MLMFLKMCLSSFPTFLFEMLFYSFKTASKKPRLLFPLHSQQNISIYLPSYNLELQTGESFLKQ